MLIDLPRRSLYHVVALFDVHFPYQDKRALASVDSYIRDSRPDLVVYGGDVTDMDVVSTKARLREIESKRIVQQTEMARDHINDTRTQAKRVVVLEGNHDERMERYIDDHPELEGLLEIPTLLGLDHNEWVSSWRKGELLTIGKAHLLHGRYTNKYHAQTTVDRYGCCCFYGHTHDVQSYSKVLYGDNSTIVGQSCGFLGKYDMPYKQGEPDKWQHAFLDMWFRPDGHFNYSVPCIFDGKFILNGRVYG